MALRSSHRHTDLFRIILHICLTTTGFVMSCSPPCTMSTSSTFQPSLRMQTATRPTPEKKVQSKLSTSLGRHDVEDIGAVLVESGV